MQNAKCKIDEAFRLRESQFMVGFHEQTPKSRSSIKEIVFQPTAFPFSPHPDFAFCILHFAFRALPDKPKFEVNNPKERKPYT